MKYIVVESKDGWTWSKMGNVGEWEDIWVVHQRMKGMYPDMTYSIIPA